MKQQGRSEESVSAALSRNPFTPGVRLVRRRLGALGIEVLQVHPFSAPLMPLSNACFCFELPDDLLHKVQNKFSEKAAVV